MSTDENDIYTAPLPFIDEHAVDIATGVDTVWAVLVTTLERGFSRTGAAGYARLVRSPDTTASGPRPLAEGSVMPGFHVTAAVPGSLLGLEGRHHFSSYALTFRLDDVGPGRSRLRAESRAAFPGIAGIVYRALVIGTHGHALVMRRMVADIKRRAESSSR